MDCRRDDAATPDLLFEDPPLRVCFRILRILKYYVLGGRIGDRRPKSTRTWYWRTLEAVSANAPVAP